jgi:hypothetical protein
LETTAALYLAHLNPITNSHAKIISQLAKEYHVYIFPVVFMRRDREVNTRTFPFSYEIRKKMLLSLFNGNNNIKIIPNYKFVSPYIKYLPPIVSPYSWVLRTGILHDVVEKKFISYTGDKAERIALRLYNLHPIKAKRLGISSSNVKQLLYQEATEKLGMKGINNNSHNNLNNSVQKSHQEHTEQYNGNERESWKAMVPKSVANIIMDNWSIVEKFSQSSDKTIKIFGMKFPTEGILN